MTKIKITSLLLCLSVWLLQSCAAQKAMSPRFEPQILDDQVQIGYGLAVGDVDGDGKDDILLADKKQFVWYRNGDWRRFVMIDSLTERDNVCLAARDIDGDGRVEVAVGAQWNPGETTDVQTSGSVHYLIRPKDPTQRWEAVPLHHEPTVHRMHWVKVENQYQLVVLPLHGRGNRNGEGEGVKVLAYKMPDDPRENWSYEVVDQSMRLTHNFDVISYRDQEALLIGGKEGAKICYPESGQWKAGEQTDLTIRDYGFGEIRKNEELIAGIQPMHGDTLVVYTNTGRKILSDSLRQGHALALADLLSQGRDQIVAGWRNENAQKETGVKLFIADDPEWKSWRSVWIDRNGMACEDLKIADLNGDGKKDIIASGRSTRNLKVYWNRSNY